MKVLTYSHNGTTEVGILKNDGSQVVPVNYLGFDVKDMNEFLDTQDEEKQTHNTPLHGNFLLLDNVPNILTYSGKKSNIYKGYFPIKEN